jgi:hypothetical protein
MYCPNSNHIFVINVDFMVVVERNLKDSSSHRWTKTFGMTFALSKMFRNNSHFDPFHTT